MPKKLDLKVFIKEIHHYYKKNKRDLPWRRTEDPYRILVSEVMLQQTQVSRVLVKYREFIRKFPTVKSLSQSSLKEVLSVWQGLGYNRRAKYLHRAAQEIDKKHNGIFPKKLEELIKLPGIGNSTAGALMAFAFNKPVVFIETNIRSVFIHYFFKENEKIPDNKLVRLIELTLDKKNPRDWYYALMDYGVYLKKLHKNPSRKSAHYTIQSKFIGSKRQIRGQVIRLLLKGAASPAQILSLINADRQKVHQVLLDLRKEGFIKKQKGKLIII